MVIEIKVKLLQIPIMFLVNEISRKNIRNECVRQLKNIYASIAFG
jgi:hypothetical protein